MKELVNKIFNPNKIIGFLLFNISVILLIYVFYNKLEESPIAYFTYFISTYSLIIFCIWLCRVVKYSNDYIRNNSKLYKVYNKNTNVITKKMLFLSFTINLIYGLFKLSTGIYYNSTWFITFAVYYLLLCFMRLSLVRDVKDFGHDLKKEYKKLRLTGIILLFLDIILTGMIILIIHQDQTFVYPGNLIYIVALYDFYLIINAFINIFKTREEKSPIIVASKCINLTVAMISMISLEVAMIYQFGTNDGEFKLLMTSITGFAVTIINSVMAIYMITKANKELKKQ